MPVYFARAETTSFVKIGCARNVKSRMVLLQAGCPYRLTLARIVEGDRRTEGAFHRLFVEHRIERDWFYWSPDMADAAAPVLKPVAMDAAIRGYLDGERGRLARLADALDVYPSAILQWDKVPAERVPAVAEATGLPRHDLRPDLYGHPPKAKAKRRVA